MKKYHNRCRSKKNLFNAVLRKWNAGQQCTPFSRSSSKNPLTQTLVVNAMGAAALLGSSNFAFANEDPTLMPEVVVSGQKEKSAEYKPDTVFSSKYTEPLRDIPQTITVIPQAVLEQRGSTTLRAALNNVPGISIQAGEGGVPAGDNLSIRGFSARTDIFIDGVRDFGGYSRDSFNFEQVEVTKGPASTYAGRGSTGGSINMVSKDPKQDAFIRGTAGVGTDQYERFTLDVNQPVEKIEGMAVRFNALYHDADVPGRDVVEAQRWGVSPSVAFGLGTPTRMTLSYFHLDQDNIPDYGVPWVTPTQNVLSAYRDKPSPAAWSNFYGLEGRDYEITKTDVTTVQLEHDFSEDMSLRNVLRYGQNMRDSIITAPRFASDNSTVINRNIQSRDQLDKILSNQTDMTIKFNTSKIEHTLVPGFEVAWESSENYARAGSTVSTTNLYNPNPGEGYAGTIARIGAKTEAESESLAIFLFDTIKLNEHWELTEGLRWDYFNLDYKSTAVDGVVTPLSRTDSLFTWRTGINYKPVEQGSIYAAYGTSFNPSAEGLTLANTATATNSINLASEKSQTYELGTKWDVLDEKLSLSAAAFRTEKTNARTEDPANAGDFIILDGRQRVDGLELGVTGSITDKWQVFTAYTFMQSEVVKSNNPLEVGKELSNTPEHSFNVWSTYALTNKIDLGGGLNFMDTRFSSNTNVRETPQYWTADAMAAYKVNDDVTMRLNVYNLGDVEYIDSVGGGHFVPGTGRAATLTSEFKF